MGLEATVGELARRYECQVCGICIATSDYFLEVRDDVDAFSKLHFTVASENADKTTVACPYCDQAVGSRGDGTYYLRRDRVVHNKDRLQILLCSLKSQEIQETQPLFSSVFPHSNITPRVLSKSELRGLQLDNVRPSPDLVVVVHRNEGRALLTDRNGFYHDLLGSAWPLTRGNVLIVLTRTVMKGDKELFDETLLHNLSTQGEQPTIGAISALGRVMTWDTAPSKPQLAQIVTLTTKAYFREAPSPAANEGIPGVWTMWARRSNAKEGSSWCSLL